MPRPGSSRAVAGRLVQKEDIRSVEERRRNVATHALPQTQLTNGSGEQRLETQERHLFVERLLVALGVDPAPFGPM
jgi:hypothetical protein